MARGSQMDEMVAAMNAIESQMAAERRAAEQQLADLCADGDAERVKLKAALREADSARALAVKRMADAISDMRQLKAETETATKDSTLKRMAAESQLAAGRLAAEQKLADLRTDGDAERVKAKVALRHADSDRALAVRRMDAAITDLGKAKTEAAAAKESAQKRLAEMSCEITTLKSQLAASKMATVASVKSADQKESGEEHTAVAKMEDSSTLLALRSAATEPKATPKTIVAKRKVPKKKKGPMAAAMTAAASVESIIDGAIKFKFDVGNVKGAKPQNYNVSKDLLTATKKSGSRSHIWLKPSIDSGIHSLQLRVRKITGRIEIAVADNLREDLGRENGCKFIDRGDVWMDSRYVAKSQSFGRSGGFQKDDVITLIIDMESFKVTIKSPYGSYEQKWKPRRTAHVAVEMCGMGTSLSIVN